MEQRGVEQLDAEQQQGVGCQVAVESKGSIINYSFRNWMVDNRLMIIRGGGALASDRGSGV